MDMSQKSAEHVAYMIETIKAKLRVASGSAIKPEHFDDEKFEDLKDIFDLVQSREHFSVSEIDAIVSELGRLRKA